MNNSYHSDRYFRSEDARNREPATRSDRGSDVTIHTLRHTHASRLIQNGMSIYEVKEILGHSDIKTTMRYAYLERRGAKSYKGPYVSVETAGAD